MTEIVKGEIENWIAWVWDGEDPVPGESSRSSSAEGRYVPKVQPDDDERAPKRVICHERAQRVQAVYDRMPQLTRQVLRYEYTQRAQYDQWERGQEIGPDGALRKCWVCIGNTRRLMARQRLKVTRAEYQAMVDEFRQGVQKEFSNEICGRDHQSHGGLSWPRLQDERDREPYPTESIEQG